MSERIESIEEFADVQERLANSTMVLTFSMNQQLDQQQRAFQQQSQANKALTATLKGFKALSHGMVGIMEGLKSLVHSINALTWNMDATRLATAGVVEGLGGNVAASEDYIGALEAVRREYTLGSDALVELYKWEQNQYTLTEQLTQAFNLLGGSTQKALTPTEELQNTLDSFIDPGKIKNFAKIINDLIVGKDAVPVEGFKEMSKTMALMGAKSVYKSIKGMTGMLKSMVKAQLQATAMEPFMNMLNGILKPLKALTSILNIVLIPLQPFIFMLEIIGTVLEAAMAPIQLEIWEALVPVIDTLIESIPELTEDVMEWINENGGLGVIMGKMIDVVNGLIDAIVNGDLLTLLLDLSLEIMNLATVLIQPKFLTGLISLVGLFVTLGTILAEIFMPILNWLAGFDAGAIAALFLVFAIMFTWLHTFAMLGGGPWGAIGATIAAAGVGIALGSMLFLEDGGYVTGPTPAMIGEAGNEHVIPDRKFENAFNSLESKLDTLIAIENARLSQEVWVNR